MSDAPPPREPAGNTGPNETTVPAGLPGAGGAAGPVSPVTADPSGGSTAYAGPYTGGPGSGGPYPGAPSTGGPGEARRAPASGFFDTIRAQGIVRPDDRAAAGVAAALAGRLGIDPLLVRIGFVVLTVLGGVGVLAYGLGWLFLPQPDGRIHAQAILSGSVTAGTVGAGVMTLLGFGAVQPPWGWHDGGPDGGGFLALASVVLIVVLVVVGAQRGWFRADGAGGTGTQGDIPAGGLGTAGTATAWTGGATGTARADLTKPGAAGAAGTPPTPAPPAPPPPRPRVPSRRTPGALGTLLAAGLALLGAGAVVVADSLDPLDVDVRAVAWATALAVLAACLLVVGLVGRRSGGIGVLAVVALVGTTVSSVIGSGFHSDDVGQRRWVPSGQDSSYTYRLSAGEAVLDLGELRPGRRPPVDVEVDVSLGELVVQVPDDLTVAVRATRGMGNLEGVAVGRSTIGPAGATDVNLDLDVGVGSLVLQEVSR